MAEKTGDDRNYESAFNFGPNIEANRRVKDLISEIIKHWQGTWKELSDPSGPHEAGRLHLDINKARHQLNWRPLWDFERTVERTVKWYKSTSEGVDAEKACLADITAYQDTIKTSKVAENA